MPEIQSFTVAWICAISTESVAARAFLDEEYEGPAIAFQLDDNNSYVLGRIGSHNVVVAVLPDGEYGTTSAAVVARDMLRSFPNIRIGLMVGIAGGAPSSEHDIRLGDIVVSQPKDGTGGVLQYDFGKTIQDQTFRHTGFLNQPPTILRAAVNTLRSTYEIKGHRLEEDVAEALSKIKKRRKYSRPAASDRLYRSDVIHPVNSSGSCDAVCGLDAAKLVTRHKRDEEDDDDPAIHYGLIASGNQLMKDASIRDKLAAERNILCFEMEAAGLMNHFPCLVIRGICDYSDSHKSKEWQGFAAMVAAAYAKNLLQQISPSQVESQRPIKEILGAIEDGISKVQRSTERTTATVETMYSEHGLLLSGIHKKVNDLSLNDTKDTIVARKRHVMIPFPQNSHFVKRPTVWSWVVQQHTELASRIALVGIGGIGKSQLAIQFACHTEANSPEISIFWVHCSTVTAFEESYRSIADRLALPRRHETDVNVLALVRDWLQREDVPVWLMILDNADDSRVLFADKEDGDHNRHPVAAYLPKVNCERGRILITSRSLDVAERLTGDVRHALQVPAMDKLQSLELVRNRLHLADEVDEAAAMELVHALDYIPLAVAQAVAYINRRSPRVTVRSYLEKFHRSAESKRSLLHSDRGDLQRHEDVSNSVVTTWQLTFEQIKREAPRAAELLSLMSFFNAQSIPEYMLHGYHGMSPDRGIGSKGVDYLDDDIDTLRGYSLISIRAPGLCEMHSLVQFCTQVWVSQSGDTRRWKDLFLQLASEHFPSGRYDTWSVCQSLMPHMQWVIDEGLNMEEIRDKVARSKLFTCVSTYLLSIGQYDQAERCAQRAVEIRVGSLGGEDLLSLESKWLLACVYRKQGRLEESESLQVQILEARRTKLGADHSDTLMSMDMLASTYRIQSRLAEAESLQAQVLEVTKMKLGPGRVYAPRTMSNLASIYGEQGRLEEAEALQVQVLEDRKIKYGSDHHYTLRSMHNLAVTWKSQQRHEEALALMEECAEIRTRVLGLHHPMTISAADAVKRWRG